MYHHNASSSFPVLLPESVTPWVAIRLSPEMRPIAVLLPERFAPF